MGDIDFDELDKAVISALGTPATNEPVAPAAQVVVPAPQTGATVDTVPVTRTTPAAVATPERLSLGSSPAARRGGRFMDMVHPSSDMGNEVKAQPAPKLKIVPSAEFTKENESPAPETILEPAPVEESSVPEAVVTEPQLPSVTMPDPLDFASHSANDTSSEPSQLDSIEPVQPEAVPAVTDSELPGTTAASASETPFLPDAKVEKRPLGGFLPEQELIEKAPEANEEAEDQLPPQQVMPAALQSDIVAIESATVDEETAPPEQESAPQSLASPVAADSVVTNPSIPQQYKTAPAGTDETPHPVFDTDEYHQPLIPAHTPHKSSKTWVFIVIIAALLIIGAGLGYFAFMAGL